MCYSEQLDRDLDAFLVSATDINAPRDRWVYTGWKSAARVEEEVNVPIPDWTTDWLDGDKVPMTSPRHSISRARLIAHNRYRAFYNSHYEFPLGQPVEDEHGFHVGASKRGALRATMKMCGWINGVQSNAWQLRGVASWGTPGRCIDPTSCVHSTRAAACRKLPGGGPVLLRVLVPEIAVVDNHARVAAFYPVDGPAPTQSDAINVAHFAEAWLERTVSRYREDAARLRAKLKPVKYVVTYAQYFDNLTNVVDNAFVSVELISLERALAQLESHLSKSTLNATEIPAWVRP